MNLKQFESERKQTQKSMHCMSPFPYEILEKANHDRKRIHDGLQLEWGERTMAKGHSL